MHANSRMEHDTFLTLIPRHTCNTDRIMFRRKSNYTVENSTHRIRRIQHFIVYRLR